MLQISLLYKKILKKDKDLVFCFIYKIINIKNLDCILLNNYILHRKEIFLIKIYHNTYIKGVISLSIDS